MENYVNVVVIQGGVVREPEMRYTADGLAISRFPIANNSIAYKSGEKVQETSYFDVVAWGKLAELCGTYLKKGTRIIISGKLKQNKWVDNTGKTRTGIRIIAQDLKFIPRGGQKTQKPEAVR